MKKNLLDLFLKGTVAFFVCLALVCLVPHSCEMGQAATLSKGVTFTTNQIVQYTDLNNLVDNATISGIVAGDISSGAIGTLQLANNGVTLAKLAANSVDNTKIAARTILASNISSNSISGVELSANIAFGGPNPNPVWYFTNQNTTVHFDGSAGTTLVFNNGQIPISALAAGVVTNTSSLIVTNITGTATLTANQWNPFLTITTTATSGTVNVTCQILTPSTYAGNTWFRIRDSTTNAVGYASTAVGMGSGGTPYQCFLSDVLSGTTKTYTAEFDSSSTVALTNFLASGAPTAQNITNALWMKIQQVP